MSSPGHLCTGIDGPGGSAVQSFVMALTVCPDHYLCVCSSCHLKKPPVTNFSHL